MSFWSFIGLASKQDVVDQTTQIRALNQALSDIKENQTCIRSDIEKFHSAYCQQQNNFMSEINKTYSGIVEEFSGLKTSFTEQFAEIQNQLSLSKSKSSTEIQSLSLCLDKLEKHIDETLNEKMTQNIAKINEESTSEVTTKLETLEESTRLLLMNNFKENQACIKSDIEKFHSTYLQQQTEFMPKIKKIYSDIVGEFSSLKVSYTEKFAEIQNQLSSSKSKSSTEIQNLSLCLDKLEKHIDKDLNEKITQNIANINEESTSKVTTKLETLEESTRLLLMNSFKENQACIKSDIEKFHSTYLQQQTEFMPKIKKAYSDIVGEFSSLKEQLAEIKNQLSSSKSKSSTEILSLSLRLDKLEKYIDKVLSEKITQSMVEINEESISKVTTKLEMIEESTRLLLVNNLIDDTNDAIALMKSKKTKGLFFK